MHDATITIYDPQQGKHRSLAVVPRQYADVLILGVSAPMASGLQSAAYLESALGEVTRLPDRPLRKA